MIGFYDYTVILTYLSLLSGVMGIIVSLEGRGHPFFGVFFLLFSGLCDTFDGKVARTKKNRTEQEKSFGIQIDSLADLVSFGVLPGCIGFARLRSYGRFAELPNFFHKNGAIRIYPLFFLLSVLFFVLAALIRLAYFNVLELDRQTAHPEQEKGYVGLPVTMSSLIFPAIILLDYLIARDFTILYFTALIVTGCLFLGRFRVKKPGKKMLTLLLIIGVVEFILFLILHMIPHLIQP